MKSMIRILTLSLLSVILFISCKEDQPSNPSDTEISYSTNLIDTKNNPVINAIVNIHENNKSDVIATDTSDESGFISFNNISVPTDNITFSISHPLYTSLDLKYSDIDNKENGTVTLEDKKDCCGSIELSIKDEDGNALKNVEVKVRQDMKVLKKGKSDENGKVKFEGLCLEEYELRLAIDGFKVIEEIVTIENCDEIKTIDFKMISTQSEEDTCCDGVFIFKPKDKDGNILNGTKVYIYKDGKVIQDPVVENGKAVQDGLCEGKYTIVYKLEGYDNKEIQVEIGCDEEKTLEHTLENKNLDCCEGKVKLTVKDKDGNVLKNAAVRLWKGSTKLTELKTDANGYVEFKELCESNEYSISIFADGFEEYEFDFDVDCNKELTFEKSLNAKEECCDAILKFIVKDNSSKSAIEGAKITLKLNGKVIYEKKATDNEGEYLAKELCKGKYTVIIEKEGYKTIETVWNVEKCDTFQEQFWMESDKDCCDGFVRLKVTDENGNLLKNKTVRLWKGSSKLKEVKTNDNGIVEFGDLCEGNDYSISIISEEHEDFEFGFDLGCNKELNFEKALKTKSECCDAILKFIVKDGKSKSALEGAKITLKLNGKVVYEKKATDNEGEFLAKELCKGKYTVIIEKDGYNRIETTWSVEKCDTFQENFWMEPISDCCDAVLKFIVMDNETKSAIEGAKVTLKLNGKVIYEKKATDKEGEYLAKELCKGKYTVIIEKDGYNTIETTWNVEKCDTFQEHFWMKK